MASFVAQKSLVDYQVERDSIDTEEYDVVGQRLRSYFKVVSNRPVPTRLVDFVKNLDSKT